MQFPPVPEIVRTGLLEVVYEDITSFDQPIKPNPVYDPLLVDALPDELAALSEVEDWEILRFAHKRGMLGYGYLKWPRQQPWEPEPLGWIRAHAETAHRTLELIRLLHDQDRQLGSYLASIAGEPPPGFIEDNWPLGESPYSDDQVTNLFFRHAQSRNPVQWCHWDIEGAGRSVADLDFHEQSEIGWYVVSRFINSNIESVKPELVMTDEGVLARAFGCRTLITAIYIQLHDIAAGLRSVAECLYCGNSFTFPRDRRGPKPQYCPQTEPEVGLIKTTTGSLCFQRARKERFNSNRRQTIGKALK